MHRNLVFQQDNARAHTARYTQTRLSKATSRFCPGQHFRRTLIQSNICGITCKGGWTVKTIDLKTPMILNLPYEGTGMLFLDFFLQTLVSSMGRRCAAVLEAQGGHTNYKPEPALICN
ncbi:hypothetical protein ElyMa_003132500 [Elysia marginata]|uniref:Tc1-like transposase DDE domain-containing protein n=1 Tax=Elysia marginata TaxID=1093978 RepID=A0AAV4IXK9_9GAST|nr:hypothetical protein ElyMa_003132500 [Elysia marginata]